MEYFFSLIGMVLVVEGLIYSLFPSGLKKLVIILLSMEEKQVRNLGLFFMLTGTFIVWAANT
ncbi:MAG: DUF2065 domain-containing protein [Desulfobacteraceae bacterium]|nr:DUF2065 domain-containing protein [Desulfobacteraceae bacterium]MCB9494321.1 DUF2065 domain-containing protein [Desulfobacteraceae bacterium]